MKVKFVTLAIEEIGALTIESDGTVYFEDESNGTFWESAIGIFRDYTSDVLYQSFLEDNFDIEDLISFEDFQKLIQEAFKWYEMYEL